MHALESTPSIDGQADTVSAASLEGQPRAGVHRSRDGPATPACWSGSPRTSTEPPTTPTCAGGYPKTIGAAVVSPSVIVAVAAGPRRVPSGV